MNPVQCQYCATIVARCTRGLSVEMDMKQVYEIRHTIHYSHDKERVNIRKFHHCKFRRNKNTLPRNLQEDEGR